MSNLGSFGAAVRELDPGAEADTFEFFGHEFTVVGTVPSILMFELSAAATGRINSVQGMSAAYAIFEAALTKPATAEPGPDGKAPKLADGDDSEFQRFRQTAVANACGQSELAELAMVLYTAQLGRPTRGLPDSSPGQSTTSPSSNSSSSAPAYAGLTPVAELIG